MGEAVGTVRATGALLATLGALAVLAWSPAAAPAKPVYRTPGYPGLNTVPRFGPGGSSTTPGRPVRIADGYRPHLLVDAAGTAHLVYSTSGRAFGPPGEETTTAGADHYCRLARGARRCADPATFVPPETYDSGPGDTSPYFDNQPGFNTDIGEGARPLASGNSLLILMHRARNVIAVPGGYSDDANFLYSSDDGGRTFTGPGIVGTLDYESGAVVYGSKIQSIGVLGTTAATLAADQSDDYFQGIAAGAFAPSSLIAKMAPTYGSGDGRSLALDGSRPVAAFNTISRITVREYRGSGDINDPANWTQSSFPGTGASLAGGSHGAWLVYHPIGLLKRTVVVRLIDGHRAGRPVGEYPQILSSQDDELTENSNGRLTAAWVARDPVHTDSYDRLTIATSSDGRHWSAPQVIVRSPHHQTISGLQIATAPDGGGWATYVYGSVNDGNQLGAFSIGGHVFAVPFGPRGPTGQAGLGGSLAGGGGSSGCLDVRFGAVHAHVDSGCFLQDPSDPTGNASIAYGGVHVNGLELRPDSPQTAIVVDPRTHTIDGVHGTVSILLQAAGVPDIKLWDGTLHAYLGAQDRPGDLLFALPMTGFHANILGFQALGTVDVLLGRESVSIPTPLALPGYMKATGQATLAADMDHGLERSSLHITIPDLVFNGLGTSQTSLDWVGPAEQWAGTTELQVPPGAGSAGMDVKGAQIAFDHGQFDSGTFTSDPYPGTGLYRNAYLSQAGADFDLRPPPNFSGTAELGAIAQGDGYALQATGSLGTSFGNPSVMSVTGDGAIEGVHVSNARATFSTDGRFSETGSLGIDAFGISVAGDVNATASLPAGTIAGQLTGAFSVYGKPLASRTIPFSSQGFGVCQDTSVGPVSVSTGFVYEWSGSVDVSLTDCDSDLSAGAGSSPQVARVGQAHATSDALTVTAGTDAEELDVRGTRGAPNVVLTAPDGHAVLPSSTDGHAATIALSFPGGALTAIAIRHPAAGVWQVGTAPGSSPIAAIAAGRGYPAPRLRARVSGRGHNRTLVYAAALHPGLVVDYAEVVRGRPPAFIGAARRSRGRIAFAPAAGRAGTRRIVALLSGSGTVPRTLSLTRYHAPGPQRPGRAWVRVSHHGRRFTVTVGRAAGAARYLVIAGTASGRRIRAILSGHRRVLQVPAAGWSDRISVTVTPESSTGVAGRSTRASLRLSLRAPRYRAHARSPQRRRRRR